MGEPNPGVILAGDYISEIADWFEALADNLEAAWPELDVMDEWYDELTARW